MSLQFFKVFLVLLVVFSSGCAFVDQKVDLTYEKQGISDSGEGKLYLEKPKKLKNLETNEEGYYIVGTVENTYGMRTADCITKHDISDWVAGALISELKHAGYEVVPVEELAENINKGIAIKILKVWVDQDPGFWTVGAESNVHYIVDVFKYGKKVASLDIKGIGDERSGVGSAKTKGISLRKALTSSIEKAVPQIIDILEG